MDLTMIDPIWWVVLGVVVLVLVGLLVWSSRRKADRTDRLKGQFKSEYDRTASSSGRKDAEDDLERRTERRSRVDLADLKDSDAESVEHHLEELLRSFVDGPQGAALGMTQIVGRVAVARGYVATEGNVLDLVSVDYPEQVAAMRRSESEMEKAKGAELTEASRRTFLDAKMLAQRILAEGRSGHLDDDAAEAPRPAARQPQTKVSADATPAPSTKKEPQPAEPTRGSNGNAASGTSATDGQQTPTTTGGSPRH